MLRKPAYRAAAAATLAACLAGCVSADDQRKPATGSIGSVSSSYASAPAPKGASGWSGNSGASGHPTMRAEAIRASADAFPRCIEGLWPQAQRRGVSRAVFDQQTAGMTPDLRLMDLMDSQPEFSKPIWDYLDTLVSEERIQKGRALLATHRASFDAVEKAYGVDRHILAAIWGVETKFSAITGDRNVIRSTATLACVGRRQSYFREEFLSALDIIQRGDLRAEQLKGSWAGAFGPTQFMPTTYRQYAVDFDGDGRRDMVGTLADMIASTANKLKKSGWEAGQTWGYEVVLPRSFDYLLADRSRQLLIAQWEQLGVKRVGGKPFTRHRDRAQLFLPAGARGPAFLLVNNFQALMSYNPAEAYALAIGHLADRMRGGEPFVQPWPRDEQILSRSQRLELQKRLASHGFYSGEADGRLGTDTRVAVRNYQRSVGLTPDGFASGTILSRLRGQ
jgi:lytic murein transglycosylase